MNTDPIPQLKEQLRLEIIAAIEKHPVLSAAPSIGLDRSRLSRLRNGDLERFSLEKLIRILAPMHIRVEIRTIDEDAIYARDKTLASEAWVPEVRRGVG